MKLEKNSAKKAKQHTVYKNVSGKRIPGTTTIIGVLDKPALVRWANNLGLAGIEVGKYVDDLAEIGTCAHYMAECHIKGIEPDLSEYSANQIDAAENSYLKFLEWEGKHKVHYIFSEKQLVSETYQYGGTVDIYCMLDDKKTLLDIKTCKGLYPDHYTQVAAYKILLEENGHDVDQSIIIRLGRDDVEGFEEQMIPRIEEHKKRFLLCRELYELNKIINKK